MADEINGVLNEQPNQSEEPVPNNSKILAHEINKELLDIIL